MKKSENFKRPPTRRIIILYIDHQLAQTLIILYRLLHYFFVTKWNEENPLYLSLIRIKLQYVTFKVWFKFRNLIFSPKTVKKKVRFGIFGPPPPPPKKKEGRVTGNTTFFGLKEINVICTSYIAYSIKQFLKNIMSGDSVFNTVFNTVYTSFLSVFLSLRTIFPLSCKKKFFLERRLTN